MKTCILWVFFAGLAAIVQAQAVHVKGVFYSTSSYCGGAPPPPDLLYELQRPKPLANAVFYLRRGSENQTEQPILEEIRSNEDGEVDFYLWPGTYVLVEARKKDRIYLNQVLLQTQNNAYQQPADKACLEKWLAEPVLVFVAKSEQPVFTFTHTIHFPCSWDALPCSQYTGPLPP